MADIKISALNQTTATTLNDFFAIVDSGSTQTSKISIENLLSNVGGSITQQNNKNMIIASTTSTMEDRSTNTPSSNTGNNVILGSYNTTLRADDGLGNNVLLASDGVSLDISTEGGMNIIGSSYDNCGITRAFGGTILSSTGSIIQNGNERAVIIAGNNATTQGTYTSAQIATANSTIDNATEGVIIGTRNSQISAFGTNQVIIIGSDSSNITHVAGSSTYTSIYNSVQSNLNTKGLISTSIGNNNTDLVSSSGEINNLFLSNNHNSQISTTNSSSIRNVRMDNTDNSTITTNENTGLLAHYNTKNSDISGGEGVSMVSTLGRTQLYDWTLHTDNIHTYQGKSTEWRNGGDVSGAISVDLSTGNLFSFRITGNLTSVQLNNARLGGEYEFWVENSSNYSITTINLDGNAGSIFSAAGSLNPTNNGYTFYRLRIIDDGAGNKRGVMKEFLNYSAI